MFGERGAVMRVIRNGDRVSYSGCSLLDMTTTIMNHCRRGYGGCSGCSWNKVRWYSLFCVGGGIFNPRKEGTVLIQGGGFIVNK